MGDSITRGWQVFHPEFFTANGFVDRGISGQTTPQMLVRFRQDVIQLSPEAVHLMAGTNDIAENTGPFDPEATKNNMMSDGRTCENSPHSRLFSPRFRLRQLFRGAPCQIRF